MKWICLIVLVLSVIFLSPVIIMMLGSNPEIEETWATTHKMIGYTETRGNGSILWPYLRTVRADYSTGAPTLSQNGNFVFHDKALKWLHDSTRSNPPELVVHWALVRRVGGMRDTAVDYAELRFRDIEQQKSFLVR